MASRLERAFSKVTAKPFRNRDIQDEQPFLNADGHLDFAPGDVELPKNWSTRRRWYITFVAVLLVVDATFASSSPSGAIAGPNGISKNLHVSQEAAGLVITVFLLGYCFGPLFWAPLSEYYGRRWIFYISFTGYLAFNFLCAFAPNFGGLLAGRFITGTFASCPLSNVPALLVDIWPPIERGNAMALFALMTMVGPSLGPVIAGFLELKEDWRWTFYVLLWFAAISEVLMFTIPETYPPSILLAKAKRIRAKKIPGFENIQTPVEASGQSLKAIFKVTLSRPWIIFFDPVSLLVAMYISTVYMLLYMLFTIYPIVFRQKRRWNAGVTELPLIGTAIGAILGCMILIFNTGRDRRRMEAGRKAQPEDRLAVAMIGAVLFPITMFWFAWTGQYDSVHWIVPTIAGSLLSTSILLIFVAHFNYLTDSYLMFAASALAGNTVVRSGAAAAAPLFTSYMFESLGVGGGGSLIGGVAILLMPIPFVFKKYGPAIRQRSRFAPTPEKVDEEAVVVQEEPRRSSEVTTVAGAESPSERPEEPVQKEEERGVEAGQPLDPPRAEDEQKDLEKGGV